MTTQYPGVYRRHRTSCDGQRDNCSCPWAYSAETTRAGRRVQVTKSGFTSARAAASARRHALAELERNPLAKRGQTLGDFLDSWLKRKQAAGSIRPTTVRAYRAHVDVYLKPILGAVKLSELHVGHLDHLHERLQADRPNMSAATRSRIHATLRSALRDAYRRGELADDPTRRMEPIVTRRPTIKVWEPGQYGRVVEYATATGDRIAPVVTLAAMTGLRRGELCGLRWVDVDLDRARLVVAQQVVQLGREQLVGAPKTSAGEQRVVDLDPRTVAMLRAWQVQQETERLEWGAAYQDFGLVFTWQDGRPFSPEDLTRRFPRLIRRYNEAARAAEEPIVPVVNFHSLRHLQASLMLAAGVPLAVVSKRLGHSSIQVTSDRYGHLLEGVGQEAATAAASLVQTAFPSGSLAFGPRSAPASAAERVNSPVKTGE